MERGRRWMWMWKWTGWTEAVEQVAAEALVNRHAREEEWVRDADIHTNTPTPYEDDT